MIKNTFFAAVLFFLTTVLVAQTPQYYTSNTGTSSNSFPFNVAGGKAVNSLILAGELSQPSPVPPGQQITTVYFRHSTTTSRVLTNFHILMAQDVTTTLTTGQFYPGPWDTVYFNASANLTAAAGTWSMFTLDTPFPYDPTKSLILFVGHCGATGSGGSVYNTTGLSGIRRTWSVGGCPFVPFSGGDASLVNFGVDVVPAALFSVPELIYYKFENNAPTSTPNYASSPVGTNPAPVIGHTFTSGGQFDSCMSGTGGSGSTSALNTGWNCNLGSSQWTMSFWVSNLIDLNPTYLFGDPGSTSFRCFYGGAALPNNMLLRGPMTDILIPCPMPGNQVFHIVYNGTNVIIYRNGTLVSTNPRSINMPTGTGFKVGGYSTTSFSMSGKMDEFRLYNRALTPAEITATWNQELPILVGTPSNNNQIPNSYSLAQNYPNPFNPATKISFSLPKAGDVKLVVFDILGREVATLVNENVKAGTHSVQFDASHLASGVYLYRMTAGDFTETKKMMLVK
jgi:hypothetical protein